MKKIVLASANKDKLREIRQILSDYEIIPCSDLGFNDDIEETGNTFYENALIKAQTVSKALNLPALADDSGICVNALGGMPGVYSARYSGDGIDEHNNNLLLKNLEDKADRSAKFVCCLVYYDVNGEIITSQGETHGRILFAREGSNGFGYDPIFFSNDLQKSMGLASAEEKNTVSHRYRALVQLKEKLQNR